VGLTIAEGVGCLYMGTRAPKNTREALQDPIPAVKYRFKTKRPFRLACVHLSGLFPSQGFGSSRDGRLRPCAVVVYSSSTLSDGHSPARSCFILVMCYSGRIGYINHDPHFVVLGELPVLVPFVTCRRIGCERTHWHRCVYTSAGKWTFLV